MSLEGQDAKFAHFKDSLMQRHALAIENAFEQSRCHDTQCIENELKHLFLAIVGRLVELDLSPEVLDMDSVSQAMVELAEIGISMSPHKNQATVLTHTLNNGTVAVELFPTYRGIRDSAVKAGIILSVHPVLVYQKDHFQWRGNLREPVHSFDPFGGDRGDLRGGYAIARLPDSSIIVSPVKRELLEMAYRYSKDVNASASSTWQDWTESMLLAKIVRFASKDWPGELHPALAQ